MSRFLVSDASSDGSSSKVFARPNSVLRKKYAKGTCSDVNASSCVFVISNLNNNALIARFAQHAPDKIKQLKVLSYKYKVTAEQLARCTNVVMHGTGVARIEVIFSCCTKEIEVRVECGLDGLLKKLLLRHLLTILRHCGSLDDWTLKTPFSSIPASGSPCAFTNLTLIVLLKASAGRRDSSRNPVLQVNGTDVSYVSNKPSASTSDRRTVMYTFSLDREARSFAICKRCRTLNCIEIIFVSGPDHGRAGLVFYTAAHAVSALAQPTETRSQNFNFLKD